MAVFVKEAIESSRSPDASTNDGPKKWADLSFPEQEALRLQLKTLTVLGALSALARSHGISLEAFMKQNGPDVFRMIRPIPQAEEAVTAIAASLSLVDEQGAPDLAALFLNFDQIFRGPDSGLSQPTVAVALVPRPEPLPKAA